MIIRAGNLSIQCLILGNLMTNCYVLTVGDMCCWVVDPGLSPGPLLEFLDKTGLKPERIILTHGHGDHIAGVSAVKEVYPDAVLTVPKADEFMLSSAAANMSAAFGFHVTAPSADQTVQAGDELRMGPLIWRVLDTAGHTPGGVSYYCAEAETAITGDALFSESIGRTDIPGASEADLLKNIRENLMTLPDNVRVLPGHGPISSIGHERKHNPFL
ncbi:MAG: MBL fold metallo-hydrolase [Planctomycetota bacterium]|nr:MBL fold metallo-hydrolase [Planctomycetota bacterium]